MLKNRLKELSQKNDNSRKIEIIKDSALSEIKGGTCGQLTDCSWNSANCPNLKTCGWNKTADTE